MFGTQLLVAPVVTKKSKKINMAKTKVWVPEGRYTDIFTGRIYQGEGYKNMFRSWSSIPVLAREGTILPLANNEGNDTSNPSDITLLLYRGTNEFSMYEDDGISLDYKQGKSAITKFEIKENDNKITFKINEVEGDISVTKHKRIYRIKFMDIISASGNIVNGKNVEEIKVEEDKEIVITVLANENVTVELDNIVVKTNPKKRESALDILTKFQAKNLWKIFLYYKIWRAKAQNNEDLLSAIQSSRFPKIVKEAMEEVMD